MINYVQCLFTSNNVRDDRVWVLFSSLQFFTENNVTHKRQYRFFFNLNQFDWQARSLIKIWFCCIQSNVAKRHLFLYSHTIHMIWCCFLVNWNRYIKECIFARRFKKFKESFFSIKFNYLHFENFYFLIIIWGFIFFRSLNLELVTRLLLNKSFMYWLILLIIGVHLLEIKRNKNKISRFVDEKKEKENQKTKTNSL